MFLPEMGGENVPVRHISVSRYHDITMRTTLTLDDDVFEAARALVQGSGKTLGQIVSQLARRGLRANADFGKKSGLPTFAVAPDAPIIPSDRARDLLSDDDV